MGQVVLLSGGMDSATCLALAVKQYGTKQVLALAFTYGQKHDAEIINARRVAQFFDVKLIEAAVDHKIFTGSDSTLLKGNGAIAEKSYAEIIEEQGEQVVDTYVPFRNGLMLSQAAALAYSSHLEEVVYGAHADDAAGNAYPDCSPAFYSAMNTAISTGTAGKIKVIAPLIKLNKAGVVKLGRQLKVPFELTRSCYEGREDACGKCGTCRDRINAFKENGLKDPIKYEQEPDWDNERYENEE
ncbi:7-cyano-7-deazaguanine synthase QueC [Liquorilactobacillus capillatus]|uniref:7-cyano-7-deazaguanine synthase n=1 Tax=Liquorilactobacillus capillatus DSM 19910 TaxID=1423731 RepID=A0A0R1MCM1_9LACO|nr:7-cyano-7-deazaguanine synthase QueC [Liquorilactobacillus capillatus]KRL03588.1 exsB protein [Liquorilactobacillus capillatus DSM 19910]